MTGLAARIAVPAAIRSVPWRLLFDGALAIAFLALLAWGIRVNDLRDRWHRQYQSEHQARADDLKAYRQAQALAAANNAAHVATENKLREQVNEASRNSFVADRDRLRAQSGAAQGAPGATGIPSIPKAAPGTPPEVLSLPPAELLRAQEIELQLNALIDWVNGQSQIDPNKT